MKPWRRLCGESRLVIPARRDEPLHGPISGVAAHLPTGGAEEDRPGGAFTDVQVERPRRASAKGVVTCLPPAAQDSERAMTAVDVQVVDVGAEGFADPQHVHGQQRSQGVVARASRARPGRAGRRTRCGPSRGARLRVDFRSTHVRRQVPLQKSLEVTVAVEAAQDRLPSRHRRSHPTLWLHRPGDRRPLCDLQAYGASAGPRECHRCPRRVKVAGRSTAVCWRRRPLRRGRECSRRGRGRRGSRLPRR
jgi:hypothetical protein